MIGFLLFWVFGLGNIVIPYIETCRRAGCKYEVVLSTPINTLFSREEVDDFYSHEIKRIREGPEKKQEV